MADIKKDEKQLSTAIHIWTNDLLDREMSSGMTKRAVVETSIYWWFNRMTAQERELAKLETQAYLETGELPTPDFADDIDRLLHELRSRRGKGNGRRRKAGGS